MPGLIGIVSTHNENSNTKDLLSKMCRAVRHEEWYKTDTYVNKTVGLGRVHLGIFNPEPQPIFNEDKTLCVMMEGEIYDYQKMKDELISKGHKFSVNNDPEFILHLYEDYGKDFVHKLNGSFTLIIWDEKSQELLIINDRYGLRPLYYAEREGYLLLGSEVKAILQDETFKRMVDDRSVADFFSFGYILGTKTFFQGIELLPPASILTCSAGQISIEQYWDFNFNEEYEDQSEEYYIENLSKLILQAVERQMKGTHRIGVPLSGGLDSRTIVASISKKHYPIQTFTFGKPNCDDAKFAQMVADKLGTDHHFFEFKPDDLASYAEKAVYLTDGMLNCVHAHRMQTYDAAREFMDIGLIGHAGDLIIGGSYIDNKILSAKKDDEFTQAVYDKMVGEFSEDIISNLFEKKYYSTIKYSSSNSLKQLLRNYDNKLFANRSDHFFLHLSRVTRFTINGLIIMHSEIEYRCPFYDNDFMNFVFTIPINHRVNSTIYIKTIKKLFPSVAEVPWQRTGIPLTAHHLQLKIHSKIGYAKKGINRSTNKIIFGNTKNFDNYDDWMRNNQTLREYVLNILLDERTSKRHYFNHEYIIKILDLHMSGKKNYTELIGRLLTFELWNRQFLD